MDAAPPAPAAAVGPPQGQPPAVPPWPRSAQLAAVFLLGVAITLLAVQSCRSFRWGSRPTELERGTVVACPIDLNHADRAELLQLPGVGKGLAERIERHREQYGAFQELNELRRVQGIGPTMFERLRPWVFVQPTGSDPAGESSHGGKEQRSTPATSKKATQLTGPVDINQATIADLQRLPTVGPKRAQLIVDERQKRPFTSVDDLRRVPGIGVKTLERLRPYVTTTSGSQRLAAVEGR